MQERNNISNYYFYRDHNGVRRRYGIYAQTIDRFLHISDQDIWMSFETAEILSSKIQTTVIVLPPGYVTKDHKEVISNKNCLSWGIKDKSRLIHARSNILYARQAPTLKMLFPDDVLEEHKEPPEYFKEDASLLNTLKEYADFVYPRVTAINLALYFFNPYLTRTFINSYLDEGWAENTNHKTDISKSKLGLESSIKNILYKSNNAKEADTAIKDFWKNNSNDVGYIMQGYYHIIGQPVPEELREFVINLKHYNNNISYGLV